MSITTVGDNLIHYEALGRGKPLIFIHGWLGSWRYWWPSMQALSAHYRTFALDLWGFGDSSKAREMYSLSDYTELMAAFVDRLGIMQPAVIVGHGLGAGVAVRYALHHPDSVARLAVVSLPINGKALNRRIVKETGPGAVSRVSDRAGNFPEVEVEARKSDPEAIETLIDEMHESDFLPELEQVPCPLLMVFGAQDPLVQQPNGEQSSIREPAPDRAFISFPACMHFPMLEESARFNRLILDFMHAGDDVSALTPKDYWKRRTY